MNDKWKKLSENIINIDERTRISWKRYPKEILHGEVENLLKINGLSSSSRNIAIMSTIIKIYSKYPEIFFISEEKNYDSNIGKMLQNRLSNRSKPDEELRKLLKVWVGNSTEDFLHNIEKLISYNKKSKALIPLNSFIPFVIFWESNIERNIQNISSGYFKSNLQNNSTDKKEV